MILDPGLLLPLLLQAEWPPHQANGNTSSSPVNLRRQSRGLRLLHGFSLSHCPGPLSPWRTHPALVVLPPVSRKSEVLLSPGFRAPFPLCLAKLFPLHLVTSSSSLGSLLRKQLLEEEIPGHLSCWNSSPSTLSSIQVYFLLSTCHGLNITEFYFPGGWGWEGDCFWPSVFYHSP